MESEHRPAAVGSSGWLVTPAFDLIFFANLGWLLLLWPSASGTTDTVVTFWQVYFITLPHRWLTLVLVLTDAERRATKTRRLVMLAVFFALVVVGLYVGTGAFLCLAVVDYVWNAWHFGAQHAGLVRLYSRRAQHDCPAWLERWGLRCFVAYAILRAPGWYEGWGGDIGVLHMVDDVFFAIPALLLVQAAWAFTSRACGRLLYLGSVCGLYTGLLLAANVRSGHWLLVFTTAAALFHATEYLALVSHYAWQRQLVGTAGLFRRMAQRWVALLLVYIVLLGSIGYWLDDPKTPLYEVWLGLNLWAAFMHYAFDGMIWKLRRPETARALGIGSGASHP